MFASTFMLFIPQVKDKVKIAKDRRTPAWVGGRHCHFLLRISPRHERGTETFSNLLLQAVDP